MKKIIICVLGVVMFCACSPNREKKIAQIEKLEAELSSIDIVSDDNKPIEVVGLYRQFVNEFPDDSLAPIYMSRGAEILINIGHTEEAIGLLDSVINLYPGYEDVAGCQFLKGYAYECGQQYELAREAYTEFVERYPEHYLAADTKKMLPMLGMSPEEMFEAIIAAATDSNLTMN